jgi:hypothetical protein
VSTLFELTGKSWLSYSAVSSYHDCGERFRLERIVNVPQAPAWWFAGGSGVHEATEVFDRQVDAGSSERDALAAALVKFQDYMNTEVAKNPGATWRAGGRATKANPNKEDGTWWSINGPLMVETYAQWRHQTEWELWREPDTGEPGIELVYTVDFPGEVTSVGAIDRLFVVDGELKIVDLKSGSRTPPPLQLGEYACAIELKYGYRPRIGTYYMTRTATTTGDMLLDRYSIDMIGRWKRNAKKAIELGIFTPHLTSMCTACSVNSECYAFSADAKVPDFTDDMVA